MTELIRQSAIFRLFYCLWLQIKTAAAGSVTGGLLRKILDFFGRLSDNSGTKHMFTSSCTTDRKWRESLSFRVVDCVVNFVPWLIRKVYEKCERVFSGSFIISLLARLSGFAPYMLSLSLLIMLSVHHKAWDNMYSLALALVSLLLLWLGSLRSREGGRIDVGAIGFWPILFAAISIASAFWSQNFDYSFRFIFFFVTCMIFVAVCVSSINSERQLTVLMLSCAAGLIICSVYGFYQRFVLGVPANSSFTDLALNADMPGRVYSFFDNPNTFANLLVFFAPLMLTLTIYAPKGWMKAVFAFAFVVAVAALIMTYSRGAWLAFAASIAIIVLLLKPRLIPFFIILVILLLPLLPQNILNRIVTIFVGGDSSINSRAYIYTAMYELIKDHPLSGVGLGASAVKAVADYGGYYQAHFPFIHAHSIYMEIWAESGIIAIGSFLLTIFFALKKGVTTIGRSAGNPMLRGVAAGCVGGISGAMIFGITDYAWYYPRVMVFFWLLVAMVYTAARLCDRAGKPDKIA